MSAAATAAGYLYASGRLRGRGGREGAEPGLEHPQGESADKPREHRPERPRPRGTVRVAALPEAAEPQPRAAKPKRQPRIEYRTRRWTPNE